MVLNMQKSLNENGPANRRFQGYVHVYLNFLQSVIGDLLHDIPLKQRQQMSFRQDGVPAHFSILVNFML